MPLREREGGYIRGSGSFRLLRFIEEPFLICLRDQAGELAQQIGHGLPGPPDVMRLYSRRLLDVLSREQRVGNVESVREILVELRKLLCMVHNLSSTRFADRFVVAPAETNVGLVEEITFIKLGNA